jgi:nicotinamidase-related amidase
MQIRIEASQCQVLVVDIQTRLAPVLLNIETMLRNVNIVLSTATALDIPVTVAQQYTKGLGPSANVVQPFINNNLFEKTTFSCFGAPALVKNMEEHRQQGKSCLIVIGCEAHVCVTQSVIDALTHGYRVILVADAISSRTQLDCDTATARLGGAGAEVVTSEMLVFELIQGKNSPHFDMVLNLVK